MRRRQLGSAGWPAWVGQVGLGLDARSVRRRQLGSTGWPAWAGQGGFGPGRTFGASAAAGVGRWAKALTYFGTSAVWVLPLNNSRILSGSGELN